MPSAFSRANSRTNGLVKPPTTVSNFEENSEFSTQFLPSDVASTSAMKNPSEYFESKSNLLNKQPKLASGSDSRVAKPNGIINSTSSLSAVDEEMLSVLQGLYVGGEILYYIRASLFNILFTIFKGMGRIWRQEGWGKPPKIEEITRRIMFKNFSLLQPKPLAPLPLPTPPSLFKFQDPISSSP